MKRIVLLTLILVVLVIAFTGVAAADDPQVIVPYQEGPVYYVEANKDVIIRARWGTCKRGLTLAAPRSISIAMEATRNGQPYETVSAPAREYWGQPFAFSTDTSKCVMNSDAIWMTYWEYSIGSFSAGDEVVLHFWYSLDHPLVDGGDYDVPPDGIMDIFSGVRVNRTIWIREGEPEP